MRKDERTIRTLGILTRVSLIWRFCSVFAAVALLSSAIALVAEGQDDLPRLAFDAQIGGQTTALALDGQLGTVETQVLLPTLLPGVEARPLDWSGHERSTTGDCRPRNPA